MVIAILMESDIKLSDDLLEAIIDKVSVTTFNDVFLIFLQFSRIGNSDRFLRPCTDICRC